jgi:MYXO-CTERM domain-containing protein
VLAFPPNQQLSSGVWLKYGIELLTPGLNLLLEGQKTLASPPACTILFFRSGAFLLIRPREIAFWKEGEMTPIRSSIAVALMLAAGATSAQAVSVTIATFQDPAPNAGTPLFERNGAIFTGSWNGPGLLLATPGSPSPDFANATFQMSPLTVVNDFGSFQQMSGGSIQFFDQTNAPILTMSFTGASLSNILGLGASDFLAQNVTFSGPIVAGFASITSEQFSFSFANPVITDQQHYTVTSSFTSSADVVVPGPGAAALLGLGGLMAARRRR